MTDRTATQTAIEAAWDARDTLTPGDAAVAAAVEAALAGTPQEVTRRGKPAVVVVAAAEYARLVAEARGSRGSFVAHLLACPTADGPAGTGIPRATVRPRDVTL